MNQDDFIRERLPLPFHVGIRLPGRVKRETPGRTTGEKWRKMTVSDSIGYECPDLTLRTVAGKAAEHAKDENIQNKSGQKPHYRRVPFECGDRSRQKRAGDRK